MIPSASDSASTRPYLIRALYEWCTDNGFTPYVAVLVDDTVQVPREYVRNGEIVLNISPEATSALKLGNDYIEFKARFAGTARDIMVPVERVVAIYARENGQGMAFPAPKGGVVPADLASQDRAPSSADMASAGPRPVAPVIPLAKPEGARSAGSAASEVPPPQDDPNKPPTGGRPTLKRVK